MPRHSKKGRHAVARIAALVLLVATLAARAVVATTFMSVEPIPGGDVVGEPTLAVIESAGYENLELWSNRLLVHAIQRGRLSQYLGPQFRCPIGE
jgi:hypothetical protein